MYNHSLSVTFVGCSPIRSLIESGFVENNKTGISLFYGVRNLQRMAYQERFDDWEAKGVKIVPVLSRPDSQWTGERGYVQNVFSRMKNILNPSSVGAILCGHKQMTEEITRILVADGLSKDRILTNFWPPVGYSSSHFGCCTIFVLRSSSYSYSKGDWKSQQEDSCVLTNNALIAECLM